MYLLMQKIFGGCVNWTLKLEKTSDRSSTFMETCQFQLHYFSIGYEWEMEKKTWKSNFKSLFGFESNEHLKIWKKKSTPKQTTPPPNP